jgi:hypothetical protein
MELGVEHVHEFIDKGLKRLGSPDHVNISTDIVEVEHKTLVALTNHRNVEQLHKGPSEVMSLE